MKKAVICAVLCLAVFTTTARAENCDSLRLIRVMGEAVVSVAPDRAVINLGIESRQDKLENAKQRVDSLMRVVNRLAQEYNIPEKDICTERYVILPANPKRTKHVVKATVIVTLTNMVDLNPFLSRVVEAGVDEVRSVSFELIDPQAVRIKAREQAAAVAKEKAEAILRALGATLGRVQSVRDLGRSDGPRVMTGRSRAVAEEEIMVAAVMGAEESAITVGEIEERAMLEVAFEIAE